MAKTLMKMENTRRLDLEMKEEGKQNVVFAPANFEMPLRYSGVEGLNNL